MDYDSWSRCEAVPLSNGIVARRSGLQYMKSPEEISSYYHQNFGAYWFNVLPKTDNVYSETSEYYGCTLAPGIPLIPNLSRRPLRSPQGDEYDYTFKSAHTLLSASAHSQEDYANHLNQWREKTINTNTVQKNGNSHNGRAMTRLRQKRLEMQDSGLESDSDLEETLYEEERVSQNTVTWLSWIITTVTTVITTITTTITETVYRTHSQDTPDNHIYTRVPQQQNNIAWYQQPVMWLYRLALYVHQADIWLLSKVNSVLRVDSWGTPQQRRRWALGLLLIFPFLWAGYHLLDWLSEGESDVEGVSVAWLFYPLVSLWELTTGWLADVGSWFTDIWGGLVSLTSWFDGSWLWAPWIFVADWFQQLQSQQEPSPLVDDSSEPVTEVDFTPILAFVAWPFQWLWSVLVSLGEVSAVAASSIGEGTVTLYSIIATYLAAIFAWILGCITSVPVLLSSGIGYIVAPFKSITLESSTAPEWTAARSPPISDMYTASAPPPAAAPSVSVEHLLQDQRLLPVLVSHVLASREFHQALTNQLASNQQQYDQSLDDAITKVLSKIDFEFTKVKGELNSRTVGVESTVSDEVEVLKQRIEHLQLTYKNLVIEQDSALGSKFEARIASVEQEMAYLRAEVEKVKEEIVQILNIQTHQNVVINAGSQVSIENPAEIEALVNSTVQRYLAIYDADKIAKVDYALASSGGFVLSVRCTETYSKRNAQYYLWGYPLWSKSSNDPNIALEPTIQPGECWAFTGSRGYMVIELSENITVTAFTLEHLPRSLSPTSTIDTAPKDFKVFGLDGENDDSPLLLGEFRYEDNGISLQHFEALEKDRGYKIVELVIESNHGNLEYTCLYRFRVHGRPVRL